MSDYMEENDALCQSIADSVADSLKYGGDLSALRFSRGDIGADQCLRLQSGLLCARDKKSAVDGGARCVLNGVRRMVMAYSGYIVRCELLKLAKRVKTGDVRRFTDGEIGPAHRVGWLGAAKVLAGIGRFSPIEPELCVDGDVWIKNRKHVNAPWLIELGWLGLRPEFAFSIEIKWVREITDENRWGDVGYYVAQIGYRREDIAAARCFWWLERNRK